MAERLSESNSMWLEFNGAIIKLNGHKHILRVCTFEASYPRKETILEVYAEPKNKETKWYLEQKRQWGDDFVTEILNSDVVTVCDVMLQLNPDPDFWYPKTR